MFRQSAVKNGEEFHKDKEDARRQSVGHNFGEGLNCFFSGVKAPETL